MLWMDQVQAGLDSVWRVMPFHGFAWGKLKQSGWLLCREGILQAIWVVVSGKPVLSILGHAWIRGLLFVRGVRLQGAAGLTGVLHYFVRGPNEQK